jgi:hypothetical protein
MKTDDLIAQLANDLTPRPASLFRRRTTAVVAVACACSMGMAWLMGRHLPGWHGGMHDPKVWLTWLVLLIASHSAWSVMLKLARPGMQLGKSPWLLSTAMTALWAITAWPMAHPAEETWGLVSLDDGSTSLLAGATWQATGWVSLQVQLLATPLLGTLIWTLRNMAPTRPEWAGASAGLVSGALAALIYALFATQGSSPHEVMGYLAGMSLMPLLGAALGRLMLRW